MSTSTEARPAVAAAKRPAWRRWPLWVGVVMVGIAVYTLRGRIPSLHAIGAALRTADLRWVWIAAACEAMSMGMFARQQRALLAALDVQMSLFRALAVTYARSAIAISMPAGSAVSAGFAFRQYRRSGASREHAAAAMVLSGLISFFGLAALYAVGGLAFVLVAPSEAWHGHAALLLTIAAGLLLGAGIALAAWRRGRASAPKGSPTAGHSRSGSDGAAGHRGSDGALTGRAARRAVDGRRESADLDARGAARRPEPVGRGCANRPEPSRRESVHRVSTCMSSVGVAPRPSTDISVKSGKKEEAEPGTRSEYGIRVEPGTRVEHGTGAEVGSQPDYGPQAEPATRTERGSQPERGPQPGTHTQPASRDVEPASGPIARRIAAIRAAASQSVTAWRTLRPRHWVAAGAFAIGNWLFDLLCLAASARAFALPVGIVSIAGIYVGVQLLRQIPLTPGGIGLIETGLLTGLTAANAPVAHAAAAVLTYRVLSCWLIIPIGGLAVLGLRKQAATG